MSGTTRRRKRPDKDAAVVPTLQEDSDVTEGEKLAEQNKDAEPRKPRGTSVGKDDAPNDRSRRKSNLDGYQLTPLCQRSTFARHDVGSFLVLYGLCLWIDRQYDVADTTPSIPLEWAHRAALPLMLLFHLTVVLWQQWNVAFQCWVGYYRKSSASTLDACTHCLVQSPRVGGSRHAAIVPTHRQRDGPASVVVVVNFHDIVFRAGGQDEMEVLWEQNCEIVPEEKRSVRPLTPTLLFHKLRYPIQLPVSFYSRWRGHIALDSVKKSHQVYGSNTTHIQLPPFMELLGQQLLAPFFLFQLFCVLLWSLDEYWYYALFTLFALVMFESTVAYNRLQGLERLRGTLRHSYPILVYRHSQWMRITTEELVPGDVVSLSARPIPSYNNRRQTAQYTPPHVPADILLLQGGSAVVDEALLTGESIPQLKVPLSAEASTAQADPLDVESEHKSSVLFGGTVLVSQDSSDSESDLDSSTPTIPPPPDRGLVGFTLRTGFDTAQGSLLRTMAHSSHKAADGIHTIDTFVFVAILLCCAIGSALMVLQEGWYDETRNRFRLVLHVIIIVTSVVPPELPMELSLAVTNSVADLMKRCHVFCTEPFRIPWAGQVNVCCFDKTGTLTSDEMQLLGVVQWKEGGTTELVHPSDEGGMPWSTIRVMAACHSLAVAPGSRDESSDGHLIGNPLERAVLRDTGYRLQKSDSVVTLKTTQGQPKKMQIHHRFAFSSRLKRMTTLVTEDSSKTVWALTKGAPETIKSFLKPDSIPANYDDVYTQHMGRGQRVLAMGYRKYDGRSISGLKEAGREQIEKDLCFAGFLILDCPLKPDSKAVITELRKSGHDVVMITGDAVLTAAEVARQVGIVAKKSVSYELCERHDASSSANPLGSFSFVPMPSSSKATDAAQDISVSLSALPGLKEMVEKRQASFCASGSVLARLSIAAIQARQQRGGQNSDAGPLDEKNALLHSAAQALMKDVVPMISVFARHAPHQKEAVVAAFNLGDRHTLMCGDGTNDVGALKRAHVGISIISAPELEAKQRKATAALADLKAGEKRERKARKEGRSSNKSSSKKAKRASTLESTMRQLQEAQEELDHVELGDASVASPFTSRAMSIKCCKDVLQQGRCTLVTMLQIYKILGVNCLVNALVLTKLHMHGVKQGDRQLTILGVAVAALFLFVTRGKPLPTLSPRRPPSSVLCTQALVSLAAQFAIHFVAIMLATDAALAFVDPYDPSMIPDGSFNPNVLNTCTFLVTMVATVTTFVVNYRGRPFVEDFKENKALLRSVQLCYGVLFVCALEVFPPLNDLLQLSPFPDVESLSGPEVADDEWVSSITQAGGLTGLVLAVGFPTAMTVLMVADVLLAYVAEKTIVRIFEG